MSEKSEKKIAFPVPVYPRSMISVNAAVNKSAKLKSDIRYLWNKFVVDNGGVEEAVNRCYKDLENLNKQGGFCDVSDVNFSNPAQAIAQVVGNIKEKQEELKKQQESNADQQVAPDIAPAPESKPE